MQFIRLSKPIDIHERVLLELVSEWMNTKSVQNTNITFVQKHLVNMIISSVITWSKNGISPLHTIWNFTHRVWAIGDLINHNMFWIIHNPGSQKRKTLSLESIRIVPFQAGTSYLKILEWGQHSCNCRLPCLFSIFGPLWRLGDQPNKNPGARFGFGVDIILSIIMCKIPQPARLVARHILQISLVRCINNWHNCRSSRIIILKIPPPITHGHLAVNWAM